MRRLSTEGLKYRVPTKPRLSSDNRVITVTEAYRRGAKAAGQGRHHNQCFYKDPAMYDAWMLGFTDQKRKQA